MFNEKDNIDRTVSEVKALAGELAGDYEIVIVDDGSTDGSGQIIDTIAANDPAVRAFHMERNTKFGGAFAEGFRRAAKDVILYMDSDLPVRPEDVRLSLPLIDEADIVTGCSKIKKGDSLRRKIISGTYNFLVQVLFRLNITDINSGYKIVRRDLVRDLDFISESPFIDVELFLHAKKKKARIRQYPLVFISRSGGRSHMSSLPIIWATFTDMIRVWLRSKKAR